MGGQTHMPVVQKRDSWNIRAPNASFSGNHDEQRIASPRIFGKLRIKAKPACGFRYHKHIALP